MTANEKPPKNKESKPDSITQVRVHSSQMIDFEDFAQDYSELADLSRVKLVFLAVEFFMKHYASFSPLITHQNENQKEEEVL